MKLYRLYPPLFFALALIGGLAASHAQTPNSLVGGAYNATPPVMTDKGQAALQLDADGSLNVNVRDYTAGAGATPTYSSAVVNTPMAATATDVFCVTGSATKTIYIKQIDITGTGTAITTTDVVVVKRSAADTGGTPVAGTVVPLDSTNAAGTATAYAYSANPTGLGTAVGNMRAAKYTFTTVSTAPANTIVPWMFTYDGSTQNVVLRGAAQSLCINMNGVTPAGAAFTAEAIWTEQ